MTPEEILKDISERLAAMGESVSDARIGGLVKTQLDALLADKEFVRKMRFGSGDTKLVGTKFSRWGLSLGDIEWLYDVLEAGRKSGLSAGPSEELRNTFSAISEAIYLPEEKVREIDKTALDNLFPRIPVSAFHGADRKLASRGAWELTEAYQRAIRAMDTAETGYGLQLIGAQYVPELWEAARSASRVMSLIDSFEMTAPVAYVPVEVDFPEMLWVAESTANNSSNYGTSKTGSNRVTVTAQKFVIHQMWSGEMEEDSILPFVPFLRRQGELAIAYYGDSLALNGDTTNAGTGNINLDDADPADTKHYLAFDGIRHAALVDNTANGSDVAGTIGFTNLRAAKGLCQDNTYKQDWGHPNSPDAFVYVADPESADRIATLDEVLASKQWMREPLLTGEATRILGHPVISSMACSKTEADGKVSTTGANNTKGQVVAFNRGGFKWGWRRRVKLEFERIPATDQTRLVYSLRLGLGRFSPTGAASGIESAAVLYDISL